MQSSLSPLQQTIHTYIFEINCRRVTTSTYFVRGGDVRPLVKEEGDYVCPGIIKGGQVESSISLLHHTTKLITLGQVIRLLINAISIKIRF